MPGNVNYEVQLDTLVRGEWGESEWFQPRIGIVPPSTAVLTMTRAMLSGSDVFTAMQEMRSDDLGKTWGAPRKHATLDRRPWRDGWEVCPCDLTPAWHAASGRLLITGHTAYYTPDNAVNCTAENPRDIVYSVYDAARAQWAEWKTMDVPDRDRFYWAAAGCSQRVDLEDGTILLPIYSMDRRELTETIWQACFFSTVVRCAFDGTTLTWLENGDELSVPDVRGLYEPSLTRFDGRYFLTLRNDLRGYVATSADGLHYAAPVPWSFDDGGELGSYNTQQHWVTHSDGLFLTYTRRGANNDHVIRHRAPLFMAEVDPDRLCVLRDTERIIVPEYGAQLGNFGTVNASATESWLVTSECMHGDAHDPMNVELTRRRGADNRVWLARIRWDRLNERAT